MQLLHVDSSILGSNSASRLLTAEVVEAERRRVPGLTVVYRDLAADPLGHISGGHLGAAQGAGLWKLRESISEAQKREGASIKHDISVPVAAGSSRPRNWRPRSRRAP